MSRASVAKYEQEHPERRRAISALQHALCTHKLIKPRFCSFCNLSFPSKLIQAHHRDYSKPLEVRWLCPKCHRLIQALEASLNAFYEACQS